MANTDKRNGFQPITSGGRQTRRARRNVDSSNSNTIMPGDAYIIEADGNVTRATAGNVTCVGIMEAVDLPGAGIAEGPTTYDYVPAAVALHIIGIEDEQAEFAVTTTAAITADDYDAGALVDLVDTTGNVPLRQSRQAVGDAGGDQFKLIRPLEIYIPNYDQYAAFATVVVKMIPASVE